MKEKYSYKAKIMMQKGCIFLEIILKKKKQENLSFEDMNYHCKVGNTQELQVIPGRKWHLSYFVPTRLADIKPSADDTHRLARVQP